MKFKKRMISLLLAVLLICNSIPVNSASLGAEVTVKENLADFIADVEYGWTGGAYRFPDGVLNNVDEGNDVYLMAAATVEAVEGTPGGEKNVLVKLTNFEIQGEDAQNYLIPDLTGMTVEKVVKVLPKTLLIRPATTQAYYGQDLPQKGEVSVSEDYKEHLVSGDDVTVSCTFTFQLDGATQVGTYELEEVSRIRLEGSDASNYQAVVEDQENLVFSIVDYETEAVASDGGANGNQNGKTEVTLSAPDGFLISSTGNLDNNGWESSITVELEETDADSQNEIVYYLRNNDRNSAEYRAICMKTYSYTCVPLPTVTGLEILAGTREETVDGATVTGTTELKFEENAVLANGNVQVAVYVTGASFEQETEITLSVGSSETTKAAEEVVEQDGRFTYKAVFEIPVADGESAVYTLQAYAKNSSGTGETYPAEGCQDMYLNDDSFPSDTLVTKPLVLDRKDPTATVKDIYADFGCIVGSFSVSDEYSGIVSVEYKWDNSKTYKPLQNYSSKETDYSVTLYPWDPDYESVKGGKHTLHLKVTDALGNVTEISKQADSGEDIVAPKINSVEIVPAEGTTLQDTPNGILANGTVDIVIKAQDVTDENSATSGLNKQSVIVVTDDGSYYATLETDGAELAADAVGTYVLTLNADKVLRNVRIYVVDNDNKSSEQDCTLKDIFQPDGATKYQSNDLYVENDLPVVSFCNADNMAFADNTWFGIAESNDRISIKVNDSGISAGLQKIVVTSELVEGETVTSKQLRAVSLNFGIPDRTIEIGLNEFTVDGLYRIVVTATDYCGNEYTGTFTFNKDTKIPESGDIVLNNQDLDTPDVKNLSDGQWFSANINSGEKDGYISFRIGTTVEKEKLREIKVNINGYEKTYTLNDGKAWTSDATGTYVYVDTKNIVPDGSMGQMISIEPNAPTEEIPYNHYIVHATLVDLAGNPADVDEIIYVDKSAPQIDQITVEKSSGDLLGKILNILSFGIFSNDSLIFRAYVSDAEGDSGVASVVMCFSTDSKAGKKMEWDEEKSCYTIEVAESEATELGATLSFRVTDRYGKTGVTFPIIPTSDGENTDSEGEKTDSIFVMIETNLPTIDFVLPDSDGFSTDGRVWYNGMDENRGQTDGLLYQEMTLSVQDVDSGINSIVVDVNGEKSVLYSKPTARDNDSFKDTFNVYNSINDEAQTRPDGEYRVVVEVVDNAGNQTTVERVYNIDTVKPKIDKISFSAATADGIQSIEGEQIFADPQGISYGYFFKENFDITVHVSDAAPSSSLYRLRYWLYSADGEMQEAEVVDGKAYIDVPDNFKGRIFYEVLDYAGNSSGVFTTEAYVVDASAPTIQITKNEKTDFRDANGNALYTKPNSITVVITDTVSGLKELSYTKSAEQMPEGRNVVGISEDGTYAVGGTLADGWEIVTMDENLVTQVRKTFTFAADDNDICMHFHAVDHAQNARGPVDSEIFTIDTVAPVITVDFGSDNDDDLYYNQNRVARITVRERNFSVSLIKVMIENYFGDVPGYSFTSVSKTEHTATITFDEGDYTFDLTGKDLGGHDAAVTFTGGNEKKFYVDKTAPMISENFVEFANEKENSFSADKTVQIKIVEHNFDSSLTNLRITRKAAGSEHSHDGMVDVTSEVLGGRDWTKNGDSYYIEFTFSTDAVYYVEIAPVDLASNQGDKRNTVVFEIDKTVPVVSAKNGDPVSPDDTEFLDIYPYDRRNEAAPTVEFDDNNISHIEYTLITYIPEYLSDGLVRVKPTVKSGIVEGSLFTLENFDQDGVYAVELVAVDVAGNRSEVNSNTYARMVDQDVLAFILDSNVKEQTGLFSLEHENGEAISKKPYDFKDLRILVMTPMETPIDIVLRDTNGRELLAACDLASVESVYGVNVHTFELGADFFRENFQDDIDTEMHLTVRNEGSRIDLARIHIDNIAPECVFPPELYSWAWFPGEEDRTFTIRNISELLEVEDCKVYDNGVEIPFEYSSEEDTITFTLSKGWHNIGFILCDAAGNANINQEMNNIHIGNFWTIFGVTLGVAAVSGLTAWILYRRKRTIREMQDEE